jgi:hypothetical protein
MMMAFLNRILSIVGFLIAVVPIAAALFYNQYPLRLLSFGEDDHIDTSIPSLFSMADIHGDYPRALAALVHAGVVDEQGNWKAGNATYVRTKS